MPAILVILAIIALGMFYNLLGKDPEPIQSFESSFNKANLSRISGVFGGLKLPINSRQAIFIADSNKITYEDFEYTPTTGVNDIWLVTHANRQFQNSDEHKRIEYLIANLYHFLTSNNLADKYRINILITDVISFDKQGGGNPFFKTSGCHNLFSGCNGRVIYAPIFPVIDNPDSLYRDFMIEYVEFNSQWVQDYILINKDPLDTRDNEIIFRELVQPIWNWLFISDDQGQILSVFSPYGSVMRQYSNIVNPYVGASDIAKEITYLENLPADSLDLSNLYNNYLPGNKVFFQPIFIGRHMKSLQSYDAFIKEEYPAAINRVKNHP